MENQLLTDRFSQLENIVREQQNELATLRGYIAQKHSNQTAAGGLTVPPPSKIARSNRRRMLKGMGLAVLAGSAALGISAATYAPAEAKLSVNPSSNVGAIVTRNGATLTGIMGSQKFGLLASSDATTNLTSVVEDSNYIGVGGFSSDNGTSSIGVFGYSEAGVGVSAFSPTGFGLIGQSGSFVAIYAQNISASNPTIQAVNDAPQGYALEIQKGGLKVTGAGIGSQTTAFTHQITNNNTINNATILDNPYTNSKPNALLFVTAVLNPQGVSNGKDDTPPFGVKYEGSSWRIYHTDSAVFTLNSYFNVLVINP